MNTPIIKVENLCVRRGGRPVLEAADFALHRGELVAVVGPNGAGKSTLLQALALLIPSQMSYRFAGKAADLPREALALRRQMAVVFQEALLLDRTVLENVALGPRLRGIPRAEVRRRSNHWLEKLGVAHLSRRHAQSLSGGESQRVALARALALEPQVLFLDEPFSALDVITRAVLIQDLKPLLAAQEIATLLITHDVAEVALLADRVAVVDAGHIVGVGAPKDVFSRTAHPTVHAMLRAAAELVQGTE